MCAGSALYLTIPCLNAFFQEADLRSFLDTFRPDMNDSTTFVLETLDGGQNPQGISQGGLEAVSIC